MRAENATTRVRAREPGAPIPVAGRSLLMGVVNATPDSFFAGNRSIDPRESIAHGHRLVAEGVDLLDIGGESTRPGHKPVPAGEQIRRIRPVVAELAATTSVPLSVDTTRAEVAQAALTAGAHWINDTSALTDDPELGAVVAHWDCPLVLMHRFSPPRPLEQPAADPRALVGGIRDRLRRSVELAERLGVRRERILLDPGLGFGTSHADCAAILAHIDLLRVIGLPLVVGPSRKRFLGAWTGRPVEDRDWATAGAVAALVLAGVEVVRVHDGAGMADVRAVCAAVRGAGKESPRHD